MDFYQIRSKEKKEEGIELYPEWMVGRSQDLMVRGGSFYAIWDEERGLWSQDEFDVQRLVDESLEEAAQQMKKDTGVRPSVRYMRSFGSTSWTQFRKYMSHLPDNAVPLDTKLVFANDPMKKTDYASKRLPYSLQEGDIPAWGELVSTLYGLEERQKIEWAIGSVVSGDSKKIQKFLVFYGPAGTGKSTLLNLLEQLFVGYTTVFDGKALGSSNGNFATEAFKHNPLVAIQHDGDLSRLEDNTRLNSIIAHEEMIMNEKYRPSYKARVDAMLFMGSNQPVKITDAKSGIIRRLIDVHPTGVRFAPKHYQALMQQIQFELGAIAHYCLQVYRSLGANHYNSYRPLEMMLQTDVFFNFIEAHYDVFKAQDATTLKQAYTMYKEYCAESGIERPMPQYKMREELRNYFDSFSDRGQIDGQNVRSVYVGFNADKFKAPSSDGSSFSLVLDETTSLLDELLADQPAQLASPSGGMYKKWKSVKTRLTDIDTRELHWVQVPEKHIVIDFDLKDDNGTKALERNLEAASAWPATYAEISQGGGGIHLHYSYAGSVDDLAPHFSDGIEVKVYRGDASLRRRLSRCNAVPVSLITSGLPLKEKKEKMLTQKTITTEKGLRELILRNLRKEIHPGTKPSVDFIKKILDDAQEDGITYDVSDLQPKIIAFANNSSNQARNCLRVVTEMKWSSENPGEEIPAEHSVKTADERLVFFDVEVYPNLFVVCWKYQGDETVSRMINPTAHEINDLFQFKLVGFYNRRYDNHILYAAGMGAMPSDLFKLSAKLVEGNRGAGFGAAYNLSYADIWDFSSEKMSLKKFEIKLGILHLELNLPWDQPVPEDMWPQVVEYCVNDVRATEAVFEDRKGDFVARQILAELSGLTVNDTTQRHTAQIIFNGDKSPQSKFVYTDLSAEFPGYEFDWGKSSYRGEDPGEGGYVYAEPGMYENVAVLDIISMHPTTIEILNLFGPYTQNFSDLKNARVAIKAGDFDAARGMLNGRLKPYLEDETVAEQLAYALKIVVNTVYGLTSAKFENPFRDERNVDNIVAKRGALFMIELKHYLQEAGYQVCHIKTDSVKIPNADPMATAKVLAFGKQYGYDFEHEATYDKFVLVNDAVYVAGKTLQEDIGCRQVWDAVGAQFQHPYVFKSLFSGEPIEFSDFCEARSVVKGEMFLDFHGTEEPDPSTMRHVGKTGLFVPVTEGGAVLYRINDGKSYAVSGTKGHLWMEAQVAETMENLEIDYGYFEKLKRAAIETIEQFGPFEEFVYGTNSESDGAGQGARADAA